LRKSTVDAVCRYKSLSQIAIFALIDVNNFYLSCKRAFRASLRGLPVIVLFNNDGCAIARSDDYVE